MKTKNNTTTALVETIVEGIREKKGKRITIIDMGGIDDAICDYMVVAEGNTPTQVNALEDSVWDTVQKTLSDKPIHTHVGGGEWIAMDYVDVMVHLFVPELRKYYGLEQMWADAKQTSLPDED
ncbi:MAG: ribosome silencing factor [Bacteroidales bacterium]|nr:ribosome silencing factor [Bacteroidales bacterium]